MQDQANNLNAKIYTSHNSSNFKQYKIHIIH